MPAGALTAKDKSAAKEDIIKKEVPDRPSFFQSPEEVAERYKQQFVTTQPVNVVQGGHAHNFHIWIKCFSISFTSGTVNLIITSFVRSIFVRS